MYVELRTKLYDIFTSFILIKISEVVLVEYNTGKQKVKLKNPDTMDQDSYSGN